MKVTLRNDLHNTSVTVRPKGTTIVEVGNVRVHYAILSVGQARRAKKALCGVKGCVCSGDLGLRGPQDLSLHWDVDMIRWEVE